MTEHVTEGRRTLKDRGAPKTAQMAVNSQAVLDEAQSIVAGASSQSDEAVLEQLRGLSRRLITAATTALDDFEEGTIGYERARAFSMTMAGIGQVVAAVRVIHGFEVGQRASA